MTVHLYYNVKESFQMESPLKIKIDYLDYYTRERDSYLMGMIEYTKNIAISPETLDSLDEVNCYFKYFL